MAYLDTPPLAQRLASLGTAGAIELAIAVALIAGLSTTFVPDTESPQIQARNIPEDLPPPPPDKQQPQQKDETFVYTPERKIEIEQPVQPEFPKVDDTLDDTGPTVLATPAPPPDPPARLIKPVATAPRNDPSNWVTADDYPARDLREGNQGTTGFRVVVDTDGRVRSCAITRSSGFASLDQAVCRLVSRRARFTPATDETGAKVTGSYTSSVVWRIPR